MKKVKPLWILIFILLLGLFLRLYNAEKWFDFSHDGDLYSWVFKDIVFNHHIRLIGQITSTPGIFIGPLFYYLVIPFFFLTNFEPVGVVYMASILGLLTIGSFYYVFKKLFNQTAGLIAAFLQAVLYQRFMYDRWVVPTVLTSIWEIWYLFTVTKLYQGKYQYFPLLGVLVGLVWHISFSLVPCFLAIPVALIFAKKWPSIKNILYGFLGFLIPSVPLILFEIRHGFSQTLSFIAQFKTPQGEPGGISKFGHVLSQVSGNVYQLFLGSERGSDSARLILFLVVLLSGIFLAWKKVIQRKLLIVWYVWVLGVILFFSASSKIISEYYFTNINTVVLAVVILLLSYIFRKNKTGQVVTLLFLGGIAVWGMYQLIWGFTYNRMGYEDRKAVVEYIAADAKRNNYPCIAVSLVAKPGYGFGFRYLFFWEQLHVNRSDSGSPLYSIIMPWGFINNDKAVRIGNYGVLVEGTSKSAEEVQKSCEGPDPNATGDLFGFTE